VSVPSLELGPPTPSPASECVSPLGPKEGEQHSLADEGAQFRQIDRKPGTLYILYKIYIPEHTEKKYTAVLYKNIPYELLGIF
jgi:hypothetical protein